MTRCLAHRNNRLCNVFRKLSMKITSHIIRISAVTLALGIVAVSAKQSFFCVRTHFALRAPLSREDSPKTSQGPYEVVDIRPSLTLAQRAAYLETRSAALSEEGAAYCTALRAVIEHNDTARLNVLAQEFPSVANPHREYFTSFSPRVEQVPFPPHPHQAWGEYFTSTEGYRAMLRVFYDTFTWCAARGYLSQEGSAFLRSLGHALRASTGSEEKKLIAERLPTADNPHDEYFLPDAPRDDIALAMLDYGLGVLQVTSGCAHECSHCAVNGHRPVRVMPFNRIIDMLERAQHLGITRLGALEDIRNYYSSEVFDYYDPVFDADYGDVVEAILSYCPDTKIHMTIRPWYYGDRIALRAARKVARLAARYPDQIQICVSLDLYDRSDDRENYIRRAAAAITELSPVPKLLFSVMCDRHNWPDTVRAVDALRARIKHPNLDKARESMSMVAFTSPLGRGASLQGTDENAYDIFSYINGYAVQPRGVVRTQLGGVSPSDPKSSLLATHRFYRTGVTLWDAQEAPVIEDVITATERHATPSAAAEVHRELDAES